MSANVVVAEKKNAAVSVEALESGSFEFRLDARKVLEDKTESAGAVFSRDDLVAIRDAITAALVA